MTVNDLKVLVENLDEYIHIPGGIERLKKTVLHLAVSGQLVPQISSEGTGEELYNQIQTDRIARPKKSKDLPEVSDEEALYDIPSSWKWTRLSAITNLITDGTHHTPQYKPIGIPFLSIKDISAGSLDFSDCKYISQQEHDDINKRCNPEFGDILFCRIGTLGRPVIVNTNEPFSIFVSLGLIKFNQKLLLPEYLRVYLDGPATYKEYGRVMAGGSHTNKLNLNTMHNLVTALPPVAEQRRILDRLSEILTFIDELENKYKAEEIERKKLVKSSLRALSHEGSNLAFDNLTGIIKTKADASELRKAILHLAVSGKLAPQDPSEGTGEELCKLLQTSVINKKAMTEIDESYVPFDIPSSWKWVKLANIGQIVGGGTPPSGNMEYYTDNHKKGIAWLTPADLRGYKELYISHGTKSITEAGLKNSSARLMPKGTVLFSSRAPIGHIAIANNELSTNQGFKSIVPYGEMNSEYIYRWLQYYAPTIDANASGTTFREVSGAIVNEQPIPLPPIAEQERIVQKTTELLTLVDELEKHLEY